MPSFPSQLELSSVESFLTNARDHLQKADGLSSSILKQNSIRFLAPFLLIASQLPTSSSFAASDDNLEHFEKKVRPLLATHCWECHGAETQQAKLRLDSAEALARGSEFGPIVIPGKPDESRLIETVRRIGEIKMPPDIALSDEEITDLVTWVRNGALWPITASVRPERNKSEGSLFTQEEKSYWAFQPIRDPEPPSVQQNEWVRSDIDRFLLAKLEAKGIKPALPAEKRTLLRRITFALIGLPPTPEQMTDFLADDSPLAFSNVIEELLHSKQYGERWGRRWLGVVRYGDTADIPGVMLSLYAYRYRDYVVSAFNQDKPYDEFIVEQLAGDLMEPTADKEKNAERVIATGFLMLGPKSITEIDKERMVMQLVEEQIDVTSRAFLGLTVACARCHDHKFDPIPTRDFYSLAGIFYSTQSMADRKQVDSKWMERTLANVHGETEPVMVLAVQDGEPTNLRVNIRGSHRNLGDEVPRRFLQIIAGEAHRPIDTDQSGRLELARWIANADNPLTARVMVNRIWQDHFGRGLVQTSDNFGVAGKPPTHPELLDWLASRFIESGWSIKSMHRMILNSAAYQQSSHILPLDSETGNEKKQILASEFGNPQSVDPENHFLWRMNPRRLEAEEIRDAVLAVNGQLDMTLGGTLLTDFSRYVDTFVDAKRGIFATHLMGRTFHPYYSTRRSIYLPMLRHSIPEIFQLFDVGDVSTVTAQRSETTVAPQALFMMNSWFIREQAFHMAQYLLSKKNIDAEDRVRLAYQRLLGRPATDSEIASAIHHVSHIHQILEKANPSENNNFPHGASLTITAHRAPHRRNMYDEIKPILENPSGVRLRLSVTSSQSSPRNPAVEWEVLSPIKATLGPDTELTTGPEQTLIVQGNYPTDTTFTCDAHTQQQRITAIRLEVLPDPEQTSERSIPDLFVLSEFQIQASPFTGPKETMSDPRVISLQHAILRYSDEDASVMPLIDDDRRTYWHVGPKHDQPGVVIFETKDNRVAAWQTLCRAMLCLNEFAYIE